MGCFCRGRTVFKDMDPRPWASPKLLARSIAVFLSFILSLTGAEGITFNFLNNCKYTVWPGLLPNGGSPLLADGGFELFPGQMATVQAPVGWSGRFWGRTGCSFSDTASQSAIACKTGDCGNGRLQCGGTGAAPPATLAEITLAGNTPSNKLDFYDVSLVDGYNIPIAMAPSASNSSTFSASSSQQHTAAAATDIYSCATAGCIADLNDDCPQELEVLASQTSTTAGNGDGSAVVACKSACEAFLSPQYCCTGSYANPSTCKPTSYSQLFKQACPRAYSYAYDDASSTFTCVANAYSILFCPSSLSQTNDVSGVLDATGTRRFSNVFWAGFLVFAALFAL